MGMFIFLTAMPILAIYNQSFAKQNYYFDTVKHFEPFYDTEPVYLWNDFK